MAPSQVNTAITAMNASPSRDYKHCFLLDIPPELRLMIYEELLAATKPPFDADPALLNNLEPALMSTCKFVRDEMLSLYLDQIEVIHDELLEEARARMMPFHGMEEKDRSNYTAGFWDAFNDLYEWMFSSVSARQQRITHARHRALDEIGSRIR